MRFDKLRSQLHLILLLSDSRGYSISELCQKLETSSRNVYYLLEFLRGAGFIIFKQSDRFYIDRRSRFIVDLTKTVQFSDHELRTVYNLLLMAGNSNETVNLLRRKIDGAYNFSAMSDSVIQKRITNNVRFLEEAIQKKLIIRIHNYSSPNSHSVKDRVVEPFYMMNNNQDVRCHELATGMNKTFRISRMEGLESMNAEWIHEHLHRQVYTDIFMFSGEERHTVVLELGQLARNIFLEEHSRGEAYLSPLSDNRWKLELDVCDYRGIGRFVLGLFNDIKIIENEDFKAYIQLQIKSMSAFAAQE